METLETSASKLYFFKRLKIWIVFARPKTLVASLAPICLAASLVWQRNAALSVPLFLILLVLSVILQVACNYTNDYYDNYKNADRREDRHGPMRALQSGQIGSQQVAVAIVVLNCCALLLGLYLGIYYGGEFTAIVVFSAFVGFAYTGGPYPLAYHGLGDVFAFIFFGPWALIASTALLNDGVWLFSMPVIVVGVVCGIFSLLLITVNNLRDVASDALSGKKTLAVILGRTYSAWQFRFSSLVLFFVPVSAGWQHESWLAAFPAFAVLLLLPEFFTIHAMQGARFNAVLAKVGGVYAFYSFIWCMALIFHP